MSAGQQFFDGRLIGDVGGDFNGLGPHFLNRGHDFLGEEGLRSLSGAEFRWIIDPLDGTTNFAHRFPWFCVSIALEHKGVIVAGVVFNPMNGEMFTAEAGGGAFLNGEPVAYSVTSPTDGDILDRGFLARDVIVTFRSNHGEAVVCTDRLGIERGRAVRVRPYVLEGEHHQG